MKLIRARNERGLRRRLTGVIQWCHGFRSIFDQSSSLKGPGADSSGRTIERVRTSDELREAFLSYFESKGHLRRPSGSLVPATYDPSVLLTTAGMQPLKPYFLGLEPPPAARLTTVQKCFRTTDIDSVGLTARHLTFFEMLGNFSIGDYFKDGAIDFAWEFVLEHMRLSADRLWATVFAGDPELELGRDEVAVAGWGRVGIPVERIVDLPRSENFWQAGPVGPCGPCSELYYDRGPEHGCDRPDCAPGCECDRFLEFWNLVFMEFDLHQDGTLTPLPKQSIDTGLGVERGATILQQVHSVYETDGFQAIMDWVAAETGTRYGESEEATKAHRVLADHARGMTFLVADGVTPSNEGRGYILRRVIRRAVQHGARIGLETPFLARLAGVVIDRMGAVYPELAQHRDEIAEVLSGEEERFGQTLATGMKLFEEVAARGAISGEDAFRLHDTYGFPLEITRELAGERALPVDEDEFVRLMAEQRERSRAAASGGAGLERAAEFAREAGFATDFVGYEKTDVLTQIGALEALDEGLFLAKVRESPFYAEGGGQVSDSGWIEKDDGARARLVAAYRFGEDQALLFEGEGFASGDRVHAAVAWRTRFPTMANHTGTHLLHKALQEVLGDHVRQAGSAVRPDKLRFDFTHQQALTGEERERVEGLVNERIFENLPVHTFLTPIDEARKLGAMMLFGEKYGDVVRVVEVPGFSRELCGGTHVRTTAEIGAFAILSEGSVGSGVRRIEAVTSGEAFALLRAQAQEAAALRVELERAHKESRKQGVATGPGDDVVASLIASAKEAGGVRIVAGEVGEMDADSLLDLSDRVKQKVSPAAVVLGSREDGRVHLVANFDAAVAERVNASDVVRAAAALVGGGGGGRPTMARAGGKDPEKLGEAIAHAEQALLGALGG
jgi:alanyl-tRNA synthetase